MNTHRARDTTEQLLLFYLCEHQGEHISPQSLLKDGRLGVESDATLLEIAESLQERNLIEISPDGALAIA